MKITTLSPDFPPTKIMKAEVRWLVDILKRVFPKKKHLKSHIVKMDDLIHNTLNKKSSIMNYEIGSKTGKS